MLYHQDVTSLEQLLISIKFRATGTSTKCICIYLQYKCTLQHNNHTNHFSVEKGRAINWGMKCGNGDGKYGFQQGPQIGEEIDMDDRESRKQQKHHEI